jgi:hypothetical protein
MQLRTWLPFAIAPKMESAVLAIVKRKGVVQTFNFSSGKYFLVLKCVIIINWKQTSDHWPKLVFSLSFFLNRFSHLQTLFLHTLLMQLLLDVQLSPNKPRQAPLTHALLLH